jgi:hypothetical protein
MNPPGTPLKYPPSGIDWADGAYPNPGTPTTSSCFKFTGPKQHPSDWQLEELPESPDIERAEQATFRHEFRTTWLHSVELLKGIGRGTLLQDSEGTVTRVVSMRVQRMKGNTARVTVTAESTSFDCPPDEFSIDVIELNPSLEKHPRYAFLTAYERYMVEIALNSAQPLPNNQYQTCLDAMPNNNNPHPDSIGIDGKPITVRGTNADHYKAMHEVFLKKRLMEETFYLPGFRVVWSQYYWIPQFLNPGDYVEDPITQGGLPYFFWSTDGTATGQTIFDKMQILIPQLYSKGISWLRMADSYMFSRTWFKITRSWQGAPYAHWDADVYGWARSPYPDPPERPIA